MLAPCAWLAGKKGARGRKPGGAGKKAGAAEGAWDLARCRSVEKGMSCWWGAKLCVFACVWQDQG